MRVARLVLVASLASCTRPVDQVAVWRDAGEDARNDAAANAVDAGETDAPGGTTTGPTIRCKNTPRVIVLTGDSALFAFDPATDALKQLGTITCPDTPASAKPLAVATSDDGAVYVLTDVGSITYVGIDGTPTCKTWNKVPGPLTPENGAALTVSSSASALYLGLDQALYRTFAASPAATWTSNGSIDPAYHFRALLGTGDGRLFAVVSPGTATEYRVTAINPSTAAASATTLVPTAFGQDSASPAGFALWGSLLLIVTIKGVTRYDFATGQISSPEIVTGFTAPVVAAASPPCASTL